VALFVPCKGFDLQLADNLSVLFQQDHGNYEIVFVVESGHDPAYATISELMLQHPEVPSRLVVAGQCSSGGQKVHNLLVATAKLARDVKVLAFVDSDARPHRSWLRWMVSNLDADRVGAVTGYRWMIPLRNRLANLLLYSLNSATAALYGRGGPILLWGGSWAIRRDTFETARIREAWRGTLSDDLVASRAIYRAGLRIKHEPKCMTVSPVDTTFGGAIEFIRRQFLIGRRYAPKMWWTALATVVASQAAFWGSGVLGVALLAMGKWYGWLALLNFVGLYLGTAYRCWLRQDIGRICLPEKQRHLTAARCFDIVVGPLLGITNLLAFLGSSLGSRITWRNVQYRIHRGGQAELLGRDQDAAQAVKSPKREAA
jgi:cellulose synthase/poly-beta-1,6-N-acetylglucosamine synthase-like glycosyltransferase